MRTERQWQDKLRPKIISWFSPRLQKDLNEIKYPWADIPGFYYDHTKSKLESYYIYGPTGSGKTLKAAHMFLESKRVQYFRALPGQHLFVQAHDYFDMLKRCYEDPHQDFYQTQAQFTTAEYLVLDDLGATRFTDWSISAIQVLINERYEAMLPTVITSNLPLTTLATAMGDERTTSRIRRMCKLIHMQ